MLLCPPAAGVPVLQSRRIVSPLPLQSFGHQREEEVSAKRSSSPAFLQNCFFAKLQEKAKFFWGYAIVVGALILLWLAKEAIDFVRVKADNKRVDRAGFEVRFHGRL